MKEIASFQIGTDIIGQPQYMVIEESPETKGKGVKIGSYTQKGFLDKVRNVFHRVLMVMFLAVTFTSCDDEQTVYDTQVPGTVSFISDTKLHGRWESPVNTDFYVITAVSLNQTIEDSSIHRTYTQSNSTVNVINGRTVLNNEWGTIILEPISDTTIMINGEIFFRD